MTVGIDVVIPAYNHYELTESCLSHLSNQTVPHNVIIVNNGSSDETRTRLRSDWPEVHVVDLDFNHPFTEAVNLGVAAGESDFIVLLNNDVDLRADCLQHLVAPLQADPGVGSVAALLLQSGEELIDSVGVTADITLAGFPRLQGLKPEYARESRPLLTGPEGTAAAYRRSAWEEVGGLDETIHAYMEILDLALKLRTAGWATSCAPDAIGVHLGSSTFGRRSSTQRRLAGFSRGYLLRRYGILRGKAGARALVTEIIVTAGDLLISRDCAALRGRLAGWRAARGMPRHPPPAREAIDTTISLRDSLALRRGVQRLPLDGP